MGNAVLANAASMNLCPNHSGLTTYIVIVHHPIRLEDRYHAAQSRRNGHIILEEQKQ